MLLARLTMLDAHGRVCCPDCFAARRLCCVEIEYHGAPTTDALATVDDLRWTGHLVALAGGRALLAAYLEALPKVVCREGHPVEVESLRARLLCGVVWS